MTSKKYEGIKQEQMTRTTVIQNLIKEHNLKSYLEIGVQESANGSQIECEYKVGVDIKKPSNANQHFNSFYEGKSRNFFESNREKFDLIFIDGDHSYEEVVNDFANAISMTNRFVVLHDAYPQEQEATKWPNNTQYGTYNGEVYRVLLTIHLLGIPYKLYKFDHGVLVIDKYDWGVSFTLPTFSVTDNQYDLNWELFTKTDFDGNQGLSSVEVAVVASQVQDEVKPKKRKPMSQSTKDKIKAAKAKKK